jgi:hypothetical protein
MKRPLPILIATIILSLKGAELVISQSINHYPAGALGDRSTLGAILIVLAIMFYWKVKGWRWVVFAVFILSILTTLQEITKQNSVHLVLILALGGTVLYSWLAYALVTSKAVKDFVSLKKPN